MFCLFSRDGRCVNGGGGEKRKEEGGRRKGVLAAASVAHEASSVAISRDSFWPWLAAFLCNLPSDSPRTKTCIPKKTLKKIRRMMLHLGFRSYHIRLKQYLANAVPCHDVSRPPRNVREPRFNTLRGNHSTTILFTGSY